MYKNCSTARVKRHNSASGLSVTDKGIADQARIHLAIGRADLLNGAGKREEALAALKAARQKLADSSPAAQQIDSKIKQSTLVGSVAPPLTRERGYGDFAGL